MNNLHYPQETQSILNEISNDIHSLEQYMDFLRFRRFRCTLVTHKERDITREVSLNPFLDVYVCLRSFSEGENKKTSQQLVEDILENTFIQSYQQSAKDLPLFSQALYAVYNAWPHYIHFNEICEHLSKVRTQPCSQQERAELASLLQTLFLKNLISLHRFQPTIAKSISAKPCASAMARAQIRYQPSISTQHHNMIALSDPWMHELLPLIDGTREKTELIAFLYEHYKDDPLMMEDGTLCIEKRLNDFLNVLYDQAVLVS